MRPARTFSIRTGCCVSIDRASELRTTCPPPSPIDPSIVNEIEVLTGGFNAEYGQAVSGVVKLTTKEGSDRIEGKFSLKRDYLLKQYDNSKYPGHENLTDYAHPNNIDIVRALFRTVVTNDDRARNNLGDGDLADPDVHDISDDDAERSRLEKEKRQVAAPAIASVTVTQERGPVIEIIDPPLAATRGIASVLLR